MRLSHLFSALALSTLLVACGDDDAGKDGPIDTDSDTDSDTETPTDTDVPTDTDTDTDTEVPTDTDTDTDTEVPTDTDTDTDTDTELPPGCNYSGFSPAVVDAMYFSSWGAHMVYAQSATAEESDIWDALEVNFYQQEILAPGSYTLDGADSITCESCFFAKKDCQFNEDDEIACTKSFFAFEGSYTVTALSDTSGGDLNITFDNLTLNELDAAYEVVEGGETWCLTNVNLTAILQ